MTIDFDDLANSPLSAKAFGHQPPEPELDGLRNFSPSQRACFDVMCYIKNRLDKTSRRAKLTDKDVYIVWFNYQLGGWKAMVSTTLSDGMYYEVTYNKDKGETYLDAYRKFDNVCIKDDGS